MKGLEYSCKVWQQTKHFETLMHLLSILNNYTCEDPMQALRGHWDLL